MTQTKIATAAVGVDVSHETSRGARERDDRSWLVEQETVMQGGFQTGPADFQFNTVPDDEPPAP